MPALYCDTLTALPKVVDRDAARIGLERWDERAGEIADPAHRDRAAALAAHDRGRALLAGIFASSPYLTRLLLRDQPFALDLLHDGPDRAVAGLMAAASGLAPARLARPALMRELRVFKRRMALAVAVADITDSWELPVTVRAISRTADLALAHAWHHVLADAVARGRLPLAAGPDPVAGSGLICLGMGKLGAGELNYSSDIDLIVFYDDEVPAYRGMTELQRVFVAMTKAVVQILDERTVDGYVFRTDLRLRPDAAATPVAISTSAAEAYYESMGQNWERAAMLKARPIGCDMEAAAKFLDRIRPFVWRKFLDFATIQDIHSIKRQIAAHKGGGRIAVEGHNVKLGRGGIREIEFFVQTQQLIWGGRDARLRVKSTPDALAALVAACRLAADTAAALAAAYAFLRRVEHRVQMVADAQTHRVPADDAALRQLAGFLGYDGVAAFRRDLLLHLHRVADFYAGLFEDSPALSGPAEGAGSLVFTGVENDPETVETLRRIGFADPDFVAGRVRAWHHGRYRATRSERARQILTELMPRLLAAFGAAPEADEAFRRFEQFLERLPQGVQLFSMFHANPALMEMIAGIMGMAPSLARQLGDNPALFEGIVTHDVAAPLPDAATLERELKRDLERAGNYEDVLEITRRWLNDRRFQIGVQVIRGDVDADRAGRNLSDVTDATIRCLLPRVEAEFARVHGRMPSVGAPSMAVLAYGKYGGRELTAGSDLDLVLIYDMPPDGVSDGGRPLTGGHYFARLGQRLLAALTVKTAAGDLFKVDLRLRPSGNKGPIATSLAGFCRYHASDAWTWEQMALTRARLIAGNARLKAAVRTAIDGSLRRQRDPATLVLAVDDMRERIAAEFGTATPWRIKYWRGGLVDLEFIAQYLQLRHAAAHPDILDGNTAAAFERLGRAGLLPPADAALLARAARLWRDIQGLLRLTVSDRFDPRTAPHGLQQRLAEWGGAPDFAALEASIAELGERVRAHYEAIIAAPARRARG